MVLYFFQDPVLLPKQQSSLLLLSAPFLVLQWPFGDVLAFMSSDKEENDASYVARCGSSEELHNLLATENCLAMKCGKEQRIKT